jgi:hypothetical protein
MPGDESADVPAPDSADYVPAPDSVALPPFRYGILTRAPEPDVVDNARVRLASRYALNRSQDPGETPGHPMDDVRAVSAVIDAVSSGSEPSADPLDVGAALVMLCNLRLYIDQLEANLLDAAQQVDLSWDLIAAIIGIPADQAQRRHADLRTRRDPQ